MKKDKFKVELPSDEEIAHQIKLIITEGLPRRESFINQLCTMYRNLGVRYFFPNLSEISFTTILVASILFIICLHSNKYFTAEPESLYTFIFVTSPLVYFINCSITLYRAWESKTYELEITCKYDFFQLTSVRMLAYSVLSFLFNCLFISAVIGSYDSLSFGKAILISTMGLFLFSVISLSILMNSGSKTSSLMLLFGWTAGNFMAFTWSKPFYLIVLKKMPFFVYVMIIGGLIILYMKQLHKLMTLRKIRKGDVIC